MSNPPVAQLVWQAIDGSPFVDMSSECVTAWVKVADFASSSWDFEWSGVDAPTGSLTFDASPDRNLVLASSATIPTPPAGFASTALAENVKSDASYLRAHFIPSSGGVGDTISGHVQLKKQS